jgi:hypothetical protein
MSGWLRYLELQAKSKTGLSSSVVVWAIVTAIAGAVTFGFLLLAAFIWLADRYSPLTAALILGAFFLLLTIIALISCKLAQGRNFEQARIALAARSNSPWLDPKYLTVGMQIMRTVGWRRLLPLVAVGILAAGLAKEWASHGKPSDEAEASDGEADADAGADKREAA